MATRLFIFLFLICGVASAQDNPEVQTTQIAEDLYLLQGKGGNVVASVGSDGVLLVDSDYSDMVPAYGRALAKLSNSAPRYLINTHWHGDHAGGNVHWGAEGTLIFAHDNVRRRVSSDQENAFFGRTTPSMDVMGWPVVTYAESAALHFNYDTVEMRHLPAGHTDGDTVVFFVGSNVVHLGDLYFKDRFPFIDLDSGGSVDGFIDNIEQVLSIIDKRTVIVPGHGSLAKLEDLRLYHEMLKDTRASVAAMKAEGLGVTAMQSRGLNPRWESWGTGFINADNYIAILALGL